MDIKRTGKDTRIVPQKTMPKLGIAIGTALSLVLSLSFSELLFDTKVADLAGGGGDAGLDRTAGLPPRGSARGRGGSGHRPAIRMEWPRLGTTGRSEGSLG